MRGVLCYMDGHCVTMLARRLIFGYARDVLPTNKERVWASNDEP